MKLITIIIPVYNEKETIEEILDKIVSLKIDKQIIVIDDFSSDGSREIIQNNKHKIDNLILHNNNLGKGAAIKSAKELINSKYTIIQDADLEYNPLDILNLLSHAQKNNSKVIYGSRVLNINKEKVQNFSHKFRIFANYILTKINNILNNQKLTDAHTCYKMFDSDLLKSLDLKENGFAFCPEVTTKLSNMNYKIKEIPIDYKGRTYSEGKKIGFKDGIEAIITLIKYKFFK